MWFFTPRVRVALVALLLVVYGCGGGGSGGTSQTEGIVLKPGVAIAGDTAPFQIMDSTADSVTVSGDASALVPGSALVSGEGQGLLRLVDSVTPQGATTLLHTSQGTLDDAFAQATFRRTTPVSREQISQFVPAAPGISLDPPSAAARSRGDIADISFTLTAFELEKKGAAKLSVSGSLSLGLGLNLDMDWGARRKYVKCAFTFRASADVTLSAGLEHSIAKKKIPLGVLICNPIPIVVFGFPIVVVPTISLYAEYDGSVKVGADLTTSASVSAELGGSYTNGDFDLIASVKPTANLVPKPNFYGSLTFKYTPVKADVALLLYGVAGPHASLDSPRLELDFTRQASPAGLKVRAGAVFEGSTGLKMQIFGHNLLDKEFPIAISERLNFLDLFFPNNGGVDVEVK